MAGTAGGLLLCLGIRAPGGRWQLAQTRHRWNSALGSSTATLEAYSSPPHDPCPLRTPFCLAPVRHSGDPRWCLGAAGAMPVGSTARCCDPDGWAAAVCVPRAVQNGRNPRQHPCSFPFSHDAQNASREPSAASQPTGRRVRPTLNSTRPSPADPGHPGSAVCPAQNPCLGHPWPPAVASRVALAEKKLGPAGGSPAPYARLQPKPLLECCFYGR